MPEAVEIPLPAIAPADRPSPWVRGPVWDSVWMLNAIWLVPIALLLVQGYADPTSSRLDVLYFGLTALFWIGHRLGSTWLAYFTEAYRPLLRSEPVRFVVLPLLVTLACFAIFLPPDDALPWTRGQRFIGMAILDYALVTYHFAAQHFGALSLYRSRADRARCAQTRRHDRLYSLVAGGALIFLADILAGAVAYPDLWIHHWIVPRWVASNEHDIRVGALVVLSVATAYMLISEARAPRRSLPRALYIAGLAAMVAIALQPRSLFLYLAIWTSQHWILAMGLASQTAREEPPPDRGTVRRFLHALNVRPWAILVVLAGASVLLLPLFEVEASLDGGAFYGDRIFGAAAFELRTSTWVPALIAIAFATGFVHYLLDRNVYRMSDPRVREAARGLQPAFDRRPTATATTHQASTSPVIPPIRK
jgi:hypothetical protein